RYAHLIRHWPTPARREGACPRSLFDVITSLPQIGPVVSLDELPGGLLHVPLDLVGRFVHTFAAGQVLLEHPVKLVGVLDREAAVKRLDAKDPVFHGAYEGLEFGINPLEV